MDKSHRLKNVQECTDTSDCIEISHTSGLYLKPVARLSITVTLPQLKSGQSISNWEVMEKLRAAILPEVFTVIKVTKSTLEFLRFDAEIENKKNLPQVISKIDQKGIKLSGFSELLKIRATEAKVPFPSRHDWDSFFRDAKHMNEMKPGERPDTVHFQDLPCRWFAHLDDNSSEPSTYVLSKVMSNFGEVRVVDIPICDPYRKKMSASINGIKTFSFGQDLVFEAYVQFKEYIGFAKCMHALQGKKLVFVENDKAYSANIKVDFDRTKHLSEYSIKKRQAERDKLQAAERELEEKTRRKLEFEEMKREAERLRLEEEKRLKEERREAKRKEKEARRKTREEKRRTNRLLKEEERQKREKEEEEARFAKKIALEERKLLIAQRKLESIRLLDELFERIKVDRQKKVAQIREAELFEHIDKENTKKLKEMKKKEMKEKKMQEKMALKERQLRDKLVKSYKSKEEDRMELQREKVRKAVQGKVQVQSGLTVKSLSSISSATSESGSNISSESDSDSSSSLKSVNPQMTLGHMRMDHMDEDGYDKNWQNMPGEGHHQYPPSYYDKYGYHEGHNYPDEWSYGEGYDRGRGRGRGRWRYPRGPWRGRGFRDRGRGFRDRGRGFRGSWQGGSYGYDESKKPMEVPKPKTTWFKRGETGDDGSTSRSRSRSRSRRSRSRQRRSRSRSWSRRSRSRSKRSRSRSRSRRSRSRSRSKSRRSKSRSRSRSKHSRSASKSRSNRSCSKDRSRSRKSHSKSRSRSRSRSRKKSRSRSRKRSKTHSRSRSHSRSHSRSKRRRHSSSDEHSSCSRSRRRDKYRNERHKDRDSGRKGTSDKVNYDDLRESDLELSSDPDQQYSNDYYPDEEYEDYYASDYYSRGGAWRGHQGYGRGGWGRWPRGWRGRSRGWGYSNYGHFHEQDNWRLNDPVAQEQYRDVYHRYFESLTNREAAEKQKEEQNSVGEERSRSEYKEEHEKNYRSREEEVSRKTSSERNLPPENPLRNPSSAVSERHFSGREIEDDNLSDENLKKEYNRKYGQGENYLQKSKERDRNDPNKTYEERLHNRKVQTPEMERQHRRETSGPGRGRESRDDQRYRENDHSSFEIKRERSLGRNDGDTGKDERWRSQVMRADLENPKTGKKDVSVKDRLSFVKREPGISHSKYDPGYNYDRKQLERNLSDSRYTNDNRRQAEQVRLKDRLSFDRGRERQKERSVESHSRRNDQPRESHGRREVKVYDRDGREERSGSKTQRDLEVQESPVSSESGSEPVKEERTHRKRGHSKTKGRRGKDDYESEKESEDDDEDNDNDDDDDNDNESQHESHHRKRRKNGKKKKDERSTERKHKHKKKKKKKSTRIE